MALPVMDAVIAAAREYLPEDDPVVKRIADVISPENVERGQAIRAIDALIVVNQLAAALEPLRLISI